MATKPTQHTLPKLKVDPTMQPVAVEPLSQACPPVAPDYAPSILVSAAVGTSLVSALVTHPIDTISVRNQAAVPGSAPLSRVRPALFSLLRTRGVSAPLAGIVPALAGIVPTLAARALVNAPIKAALVSAAVPDAVTGSSNVPLLRLAAAGWLAGAVEGVVAAPFSAAKVRLQTADMPGSLNARGTTLRAVLKDVGTMGLMRGVSLSAMHKGLAASVLFVGYEAGARWLTMDPPLNHLIGAERVLAGGGAAVLATLVAHPLDVLKTRVQRSHVGHNGTLGFALVHTIQREGLAAFVRGAYAALSRSLVGSVVSLTIYELVIRANRAQ